MAYKPAEQMSWKEINGFVVIVDLRTGEYYSLNKTASSVWCSLAKGDEIADTVRVLVGKFQVDETEAHDDVSGCIGEWVKMGLLINA